MESYVSKKDLETFVNERVQSLMTLKKGDEGYEFRSSKISVYQGLQCQFDKVPRISKQAVKEYVLQQKRDDIEFGACVRRSGGSGRQGTAISHSLLAYYDILSYFKLR
jgi:hypothetical protein